MQNTVSTVAVNIGQELVNDVRRDIVEYLDHTQGINSATVGQHINRLMLVDYSPGGVSAQGIMTDVDQYFETDGPATCLISM